MVSVPRPRLTGPSILGVRPGHPLVHWLTASGGKPVTFSATGLPEGCLLNASTGELSGRLTGPGEYKATVTARNAAGDDSREFTIVVGEGILLTPPMGWNSWNCWGGSVSAEKVLSSARAMVDLGLRDHGWSFINIDDGWQGVRGGPHTAIQGNRKFPDMAGLVAEIHALGLRAGIYSTPWRGTYEGHVGGSCDNSDGTYDWMPEANEDNKGPNRQDHWVFGRHDFSPNDVRQWGEWGFDYLKYDWNPNDVPHVSEMSRLLRECGRDIALSLSNTAPIEYAAEWARLAQVWRTTGDITDTWESMRRIWESQERWHPFGGPGHWNDPDMLVVGRLGWGPELRPTRLTHEEQRTHISLWCLLSAPLLLGCDIAALDEFTLSLLTNDDVLVVNQDPLGISARRVAAGEEFEVWAKTMADGSVALGLFNLGDVEMWVRTEWATLGLPAGRRARDLWSGEDLGEQERGLALDVPPHGVRLVQVAP